MAQKMNLLNKLHQEFVVDKIKSSNWSNGPIVVELDTTEVCNFACPGCISEDLVSKRTAFSKKRLLEIGEEIYNLNVKAVILIGGGEPLAHPNVGDLITFLGEHDIHIGITTNGYFIEKHINSISKYAKWTRVSIDAATESTFLKLRPAKDGTSKFNEVIRGMEILAKRKNGVLGYSFLIRTPADGFGIESNIHEIYNAGLLAKNIGCDYFELKPSYSYLGGKDHALVKHDKYYMEKAKYELERLKELETSCFKIVTAINLDDSLNCVEKKQEKKYNFCPSAYLRTLICPSGVYVCPYWRGRSEYKIGNIMVDSLQDIWQSVQRAGVMNSLDPSKQCDFHCLRHETNNEIIKLRKMKKEDIDIINEYDRFI